MKTLERALHPPDPTIRIRPVRLSDCTPLYETCWMDRTPAAVQQIVSRAQHFALQGRGLGIVVVSPDGEDLLAYGQLTLWANCAEISDLVVIESQRGRGLGTAMIQFLVRAAREMHMSCVEIGAAETNPRARALYERLGFQAFKTTKVDVGDGPETVTYLRLEIPASRSGE